MRIRFLILFVAFLAAISPAQDSTDKTAPDQSEAAKAADRKRETDESSSRETKVDISPPADDAKTHPGSKGAVADLDGTDRPDPSGVNSGIQEFHPWSPLKAIKDIEVGDFYYKRKNYKAAVERYKDALYYKEGDAVATFKVAECQEKLGNKAEAQKYYEQYLKILPEGPLAKEAHSSLAKLEKKQ